MKYMKKILAMALALMMVLSLATTAFASGTVTNSTDRAYKAYQIFKGTQSENSEVLGDVEWGTGINDIDFLTALKADDAFKVENVNIFAECITAADVAAKLATVNDKSSIAQAFANLAEKHLTDVAVDVAASTTTTLDSGYYLLVDQTVVDGEHKAKNPALLQVTNGTLTITTKYDTPKIDKTIKGEGEAADANIGDTVTFELTATMPSTFEGYDTYKVVFHDTMSKGLTYVEGSITVPAGFTSSVIKNNDGTTTITVTNDNVLDDGVTAGAVLTVTYQATLNADAVIGAEGNPNEVYLEYSNDPDWEGDGEDDEEPTGNTPTDEVVVFVYELDVDKVNKDGDTLAGAEFVLLNSDKTKIAKVANGKLVEWVDINTVTANPDGTYPADYTLVSNDDGKFAIAGLDAGTYYLRETKAPAGYNKLTDDIQLVIAAEITDTEDKQSLDELTITVGDKTEDGDVNTGIVKTQVINNAGTELPETGGMGTTLFYLVGGIMVLAAVVLLVTKKRMSVIE